MAKPISDSTPTQDVAGGMVQTLLRFVEYRAIITTDERMRQVNYD